MQKVAVRRQPSLTIWAEVGTRQMEWLGMGEPTVAHSARRPLAGLESRWRPFDLRDSVTKPRFQPPDQPTRRFRYTS